MKSLKRLFTLVLLACSCCFFSCGEKSEPSPIILVTTWNLQHEHAVLYEDNVKIIDTVYTASAKTYATVQFNANDTFSSSSLYTPSNTTLLNVPTSGATTGTYSYSANSFTIVPGLAGWFSYATGSSSGPVDESSSTQITTLSSSDLDIHATGTFGITNSTGVHIFNEVIDYYYTR